MADLNTNISIKNIVDKVETLTLNATDKECGALKERLAVIDVKSVQADIQIAPQSSGYVFHVSGQLRAHVVQECVITMEPIDSIIDEDFEAWYAKKDSAVSFAGAKHNHVVRNQDPEASFVDERDDPEPIIDGIIELAELITQQLALSIPAYPRKEGAESGLPIAEEMEADAQIGKKRNPFDVLKALKEKK